MNEAFKPDTAEPRAPASPGPPEPQLEPEAPPPLQAPPRRRGLLLRIALVVVLAAAAVFAWQKIEKVETGAPSTAEGPNAGRSGMRHRLKRAAVSGLSLAGAYKALTFPRR